ncbi:cytochrome c oxidase subunit I [Tunturiibacter gelidoferens]|uniref:Cytochrome c oxidase subunit 1 n=1 Tax=Tunturiibacter lichenicola TaxID=2051959 RepID=A0A7Y9NNG9_9BACT|nr:cbb3-type cytochrome c oxidase subunit I [Edaphobacter lichenicola]NYF52028.1 cytochrome c oxidase subunit 1 [Edaphobacter lichenicola]
MTPPFNTPPAHPHPTTVNIRTLRAVVFTTDHRVIGIQYLVLALISVVIGTLLSLLMRIHLVWPNWPLPLHGPILPEDYLALVTIHGTIMLFFVLTTAPQSGFGNLILPAQIGARTMAFPALNAASFWLTAAALVVLLGSTFVPGGAAISGWTAYPPLSAITSAGPGQALGMDLWLTSIALFAIASTASSINTLTTILRNRCTGMTWERLPLTVWGWFTAALLSIIAFSVLLAAILLLLCDRHAGTSFFVPNGDLVNGILHKGGNGSPLLWLHLFWFFGHPEVYIAILPGMGLTSMLLANFSHRRVFAYRTMIATTLLIGFLGILLWGHHMFVAGLNPFASSAFSISTMAIALPAAAKVLSWLATTWRSRPSYKTPMLFALGFVSLFITGGLTGPILAQPILDEYLHNTFFVVAHFHLIMAVAGVFGLYAATYYWFPLLTATRNHPGRLLSEPLGHLHFWCTLLGAYAVFLPMHLTGLAGEPRHYAQLTGIPGPGGSLSPAGALLSHTLPLNQFITYAAIFLASAQLVFLFNLTHSLRKGKFASSNPWQATTLEWHPTMNPFTSLSASDTPEMSVHRAPCHYQANNPEVSFLPQWEPIPLAQDEIEDATDTKPE